MDHETSESGFRNGAFPLADGRTRFSVWAPRAARVRLLLNDEPAGTLEPLADGYHAGTFQAPVGTRYRYLLDDRGPFADPASRSQPKGVHGPSEVVPTTLVAAPVGTPAGPDAGPAPGPGPAPAPGPGPAPGLPQGTGPTWRGVPMAAQVICEVHVGTFSEAGTFDGVAEALGHLRDAGYTVVELMPVAEFPGNRNWGYDGVLPFAVHHAYGGREGLARLCRSAHRHGLAVVLDVVYNHFGPEGSVLEEYGPYLTDRYRTPWGKAVNVDGPGSDEVRRFFVEHAVSTVRELGVDGFRLDAVHEIADRTASPFVAELVAAVHAEGRRLGRILTVTAESPDDDPRLVTAAEAGGTGCDGVWNDDFHHALRVSLTGQRDRYFGDYRPVEDLGAALTGGFVFTGRRAPSRGRRHGAAPARPLAGDRLVAFAQNHDQIGNGGFGRRLADELPLEAQFPIAAIVLLGGWVPLRFMGEEYGETAPFHFFTDHGDPELVRAVREGRRDEIGHQLGTVAPDPQDPGTFAACRVDRSQARAGVHAELLAWQRRLLALRRHEPALGTLEPARSTCWADPATGALALLRRADPSLGGRPVLVAVVLRPEPVAVEPPLPAATLLHPLAWRGASGAVGQGEVLLGDPPRLSLGGHGVLVAAVEDPPPPPPGR